uniref:CFA20 domain-containing protein n=1 Tax=Myripristis murdjan TaxID=586833 RepID=A0A667YIC5_9TELE
MFKHNYQGGAVVEIFSAQGKDPVAKWKLNGGIAIPFVLRFLFFFPDSFINRVTDIGHLKRRLYLSTVHKDLSITPLHARIPLVGLKRNIWSNLCIDLVSFTGELFKGAGFLTLDGITLSASCKLRKIFTMKTEPACSAACGVTFGAGLMDLIPRSCHFQPDVNHITLVLNMDMVRKADVRTGLVNTDTGSLTTIIYPIICTVVTTHLHGLLANLIRSVKFSFSFSVEKVSFTPKPESHVW